jgi:hypothetical protein
MLRRTRKAITAVAAAIIAMTSFGAYATTYPYRFAVPGMVAESPARASAATPAAPTSMQYLVVGGGGGGGGSYSAGGAASWQGGAEPIPLGERRLPLA